MSSHDSGQAAISVVRAEASDARYFIQRNSTNQVSMHIKVHLTKLLSPMEQPHVLWELRGIVAKLVLAVLTGNSASG